MILAKEVREIFCSYIIILAKEVREIFCSYIIFLAKKVREIFCLKKIIVHKITKSNEENNSVTYKQSFTKSLSCHLTTVHEL